MEFFMKIGIVVFGKSKNLGGGAKNVLDIGEELKKMGHKIIFSYPEEKPEFAGVPTLIWYYPRWFSILEKKKKILSCDVILATNDYGVPLYQLDVPVITIFGSCAAAQLDNYPQDLAKYREYQVFQNQLHKAVRTGVITPYDARMEFKWKEIGQQFAAEKSDYIVSVSNVLKDQVKFHYDVKDEKITTIYNGVSKKWLKSRKPARRPTIVSWGTFADMEYLFYAKGVFAISEVLGEIDYPKKIVMALTPKPGLYSRFFAEVGAKFYGNASHREIRKHTRYGDIFIQASLYEGFGLSLAEAMMAGLAPVVYKAGFVTELIEDGVNGYIVHNTEEMEIRIRELLRSKKKRLSIAEKAQQTALKYFEIKKIAKQYDVILSKIVEENKANITNSFRSRH